MHGLELAFVLVTVVGFVVLLGSLILGDLLDLGGHLDIGGHVEIGSHDIGSHDVSDGPQLFSLSVLSASAVGFGTFGYVTRHIGAPSMLALLFAAVGFVGIGFGAFFGVLKPLAKQQSNRLIGRYSYVNCVGRMVLPASPEEIGLVEFRDINNALVRERAVAEDELPAGSQVLVYDVAPGHVMVMSAPPQLLSEV